MDATVFAKEGQIGFYGSTIRLAQRVSSSERVPIEQIKELDRSLVEQLGYPSVIHPGWGNVYVDRAGYICIGTNKRPAPLLSDESHIQAAPNSGIPSPVIYPPQSTAASFRTQQAARTHHHKEAQVDHWLKQMLLNILRDYPSGDVLLLVLADVGIGIVKQRTPEERKGFQSTLSQVVEAGDENFRDQLTVYWQHLWYETVFGPVRSRIPDGTKPVTTSLINEILKLMQGRPYLEKLYTWMAVCEEWLQICDLNWIMGVVRLNPRVRLPSDQELPEWIIGQMLYILE